jgi:Lamin Tail Domain/Bacterial Ig domain
MSRACVLAITLAACGGSAPDIKGLGDQQATVGSELDIELDGTDPDGDTLTYAVHPDVALSGPATLTETPTGAGLFRWTPLAADIGSHTFDFTVSDGSNDTTVSITIEVVAASGSAPVFRQPLGAGRVVDPATEPCFTVDILIEDSDSTQVTIAQEAPLIDGGQLMQLDGLTGSWMWCPTAAQIAASDRYTLVLSADDGTNPKTIKDYVIVLHQAAGPTLVINEVDYDQVGTDTAEYIEIFNASSEAVSLQGLQVLLVNGANNTVYDTIDLGGADSLAPHQYLVIGGALVAIPGSAKKIDPLWVQDRIQNGAPDGIVLVDSAALVVIDALSYEGSITAAQLTGFPAPVSLVEGTATTATDSNTQALSLCRNPDGQDTNNAANDWTTCATLTPGAPNAL